MSGIDRCSCKVGQAGWVWRSSFRQPAPESVRHCLAQKFGHELADVEAAMEALAQAYSPDQLAAQAYSLYEQFRPDVPEGKQGWGAAGQLDLDHIRSLGEEK
jgi:hypothetical protein